MNRLLDQMPKPQGASSAISKESFFLNFFTGMFSGAKDSRLDSLGIKDVHFKYVGDELHIKEHHLIQCFTVELKVL